MGNQITYSSAPVTDLRTENGKHCEFVYAVASVQGWRKKQEDAFKVIIDFHGGLSYLAVFDGHGGSEIAEFLKMYLHNYIKGFLEEYDDIELALHSGFLSCDSSLRDPEVKAVLNSMVENEDDAASRILKSHLLDVLASESSADIAGPSYESKRNKSSGNSVRPIGFGGSGTEPKQGAAVSSGDDKSGDQVPFIPGPSGDGDDPAPSGVGLGPGGDSPAPSGVGLRPGGVGPRPRRPGPLRVLLVPSGSGVVDSSGISARHIGFGVFGSGPTYYRPSPYVARPSGVRRPGGQVPSVPGPRGDGNNPAPGGVRLGSGGDGPAPSGVGLGPGGDSPAPSGVDLGPGGDGPAPSGVGLGPGGDGPAPSGVGLGPGGDGPGPSQGVPVPRPGAEDIESIQYLLNEDLESSDSEDADFDVEDEESSSESTDEEMPLDAEALLTQEPGDLSGSTATIALLCSSKLFVANVGDSKCVLSRNGQAIDMSLDHSPHNPEELLRIKNAGGSVSADGRVNNLINLSRAFGDFKLKGPSAIPAEQPITAEPYIKSIDIEKDDDFLVIASDGIWNSFSSQGLVDYISVRIKAGDCTLNTICEEIFKFIMPSKLSDDGTGCDNMTLLIIKLNATDESNFLIEEESQNMEVSTSGESETDCEEVPTQEEPSSSTEVGSTVIVKKPAPTEVDSTSNEVDSTSTLNQPIPYHQVPVINLPDPREIEVVDLDP